MPQKRLIRPSTGPAEAVTTVGDRAYYKLND